MLCLPCCCSLVQPHAERFAAACPSQVDPKYVANFGEEVSQGFVKRLRKGITNTETCWRQEGRERSLQAAAAASEAKLAEAEGREAAAAMIACAEP